MMVSRYFSRKIAHSTMRKYPLRSASFSAMGVAASPGKSVMAAEAAVEAAVSSSTVSCFLSSDSMACEKVWGWLIFCATGKNETSARVSSSAAAAIFLLTSLFMGFSLLGIDSTIIRAGRKMSSAGCGKKWERHPRAGVRDVRPLYLSGGCKVSVYRPIQQKMGAALLPLPFFAASRA